MKMPFREFLFMVPVFFIIASCKGNNSGTTTVEQRVSESRDSIPEMAQKLLIYYKDFVGGYSNNYLLFKDGTRLIWDDGKKKSSAQLLANPDIKDMFSQKYSTGEQPPPPANSDPGRITNEAFFKKIYGHTQKEVESHLTEIEWCPKLVKQKIKVTTINGINKKLLQVSREFDEHPELKKYISNIAGTFNWRTVHGTNRLSMHSFGITIDINTAYSNYWQWDCKCTNENISLKYRNQVPKLVVDIFEKYGFIWGGKWYHYDTMHFEYRPELM